MTWITHHVGRLGLMAAALFLLSAVGAAAAAAPLELRFEGVEGPPLENVRAALALPPGLVQDGRVNQPWLERFRRQIPEKVGAALEPFGYYHATTETRLAGDPGEEQVLTVRVSPGEPVQVEAVRVEVTGAEEPALERLARDFPLPPGSVLRHDLYEEAKGALKSRAVDLGYLDADFPTHVIRVDPEQNRAEIELVLETGARYHFGEIFVHGAPDYPDPFLRRYLSFAQGDVFSFAELGKTQLNYFDSDRFKEVLVTPRKELARENRVPVAVQLTPGPSKRLQPGIGYATDTGARVTLRYRDLNVRDRGEEIDAEFTIAQLKQSLGAVYILPRTRDLDSHTALKAGLERENLDIYDTQKVFVEVEEVRGFGDGRLGSVYLRLLQEDYDIGEEENARSRLVLPGVRFSQRRYPEVVRPRRGYRFDLEARGTHPVLGSDSELYQFLGGLNFLLPLPWDFVLFARGNGGVTAQSDPLSEIPPSLRFFAGGDQSVRGYAYQSLGPEDDSGDVVGGKNLLVGSLELERDLTPNWGAAVFYDAGNAFNSFNEIDLKHAVGLGVRRYTPVGAIKVDLARQIYVSDPSFRLHVSVGFGW